jgi:hypothetical protein
MNNVFVFTPSAELNAKQNVEFFIRRCREECTAFGTDLPFDERIWDISSSIVTKGRNRAVRVIFSNYHAAKSGREIPTMSASFLPFAKAYFRYSFALRPSTAWPNRLVALRAIDEVLSRRGPHSQVTSISHEILDEARDLILEGYSHSVAAKVAGEIEFISDFLMESELAQLKNRWLRNLSRPADSDSRVGKAADKARAEKMPSVRAIEAMAHLFCNATEPDELYIGSALALLHCAPQRINETVRLPVSCEVESFDLEKRTQYGLRLPGSKGFDNSVRWILPTMIPVARKAIKNLINVSESARKIALWYEHNPRKLFLPEQLEHLRTKEFLLPFEVSQILYGNVHEQRAYDWCKREKVASSDGKFSFDSLQMVVVAMLPKAFPYAQPGLLFSDALFICRRFEMHATLTTYACLIDYITSDKISSRINRSSSGMRTIFERLNLSEDDGSPISVRSHQLRHYLNTLAQANNVSQIDIALWSGRADIRQNSAYDHVSSESLLAKARNIALHKNSDVFGGDLNTKAIRIAVRRDEVTGVLRNKSAHITDYGMCTHEYSSSPCQINFDCLNCNELVCVKGDNVKLANIVRLEEETKVLLASAEEAEKDFVHGASRWVVHQRRTLDHAKKLIAILSDASIPDGAVVKLAGIETASRLKQAEAERNEDKFKKLPGRVNKLLERIKCE